MPLYQYVKTQPVAVRTRSLIRQRLGRSRGISFLFMTLGGAILLWAIWPIVSFTLFTAPLFSTTISPLTSERVKNSSSNSVGNSTLSPLVLATDGNENNSTPDYTNANIWFPARPQKKIVAPVNIYKLSIPKLKIVDASVIIAGDDLDKSLIHYGGTGLPGEYGTAVIFGHSVLPQFFNPKDYHTIFSTLPTLKIGDEIFVSYDGIDYRYQVFEMVITEPEDLSVLEQRFDDSYLTLITCVPPGTYWKRLSVKAKLSRLSS